MIEASNLTMYYGATCALDAVSFRVEDKEIVGLLGPNGAGKTTIMRILTTFIYPTQGTAKIAGFDVTQDPIRARQQIGYLPENPPLYTDMRVDEYLKFVGAARGLRGANLKARMDWVVSACGISSVWKHTIYELSLGFRQRLGLAQALIHDPKVVILDEPTSGLDPIQIIGIRNLIRDLAKTKTIIFSTHILQEASAISNRLVIINRGKIVAQGTPTELRTGKDREQNVYVTLQGSRVEIETALKNIPAIKTAKFLEEVFGAPRFLLTVASYNEAADNLNRISREKNWLVKELAHQEQSLEDVFVALFKRSEKESGTETSNG